MRNGSRVKRADLPSSLRSAERASLTDGRRRGPDPSDDGGSSRTRNS
jgi:hypothetical protein